MSVRFAARKLPHLSVDPHGWIEDQLPVQDWSLEFQRERMRSTLTFALPSSDQTLLNSIFFVNPDDHSQDVGSVIHAYMDGFEDINGDPAPFISFLLDRRADGQEEQATEDTALIATHLLAAFDHASVYPWDYPRIPSVETDWMYDADSILDNGGFESGGTLNEIQAIYINDDVDGGTWSATFEGNTASGLAWNITQAALQTALETAFTTVISLSVSGSGSSASPFHVEFTDPGGLAEPMMTLNGSALTASGGMTGAAISIERVQGGGLPGIGNWTKSTGLPSGILFGSYASDGFRIDSTRFHSGTFSLRINGLSQFSGAQQVVQVIPGMRYRAGIWVNTDSATDTFRLVIRDRFEVLVAHSVPFEDTIDTPGQWKEFTCEFTAPSWTNLLVFRFAYVGTGNPLPFWIDDAYLSPGGAAATIGQIWLDLLDDVQGAHPGGRNQFLLWVVPSFDAANDSAGNAWPGVHKMTINEGSTYGQLLEHHSSLYHYEFDLRYSQPDDTFYFDIFNPGAMGTSHPTDFPAIVVGPGVAGGEAVRSAPRASHAFVRGSKGEWAQTLDGDAPVNALLAAAWGRRESFITATDAHDDWALNQIRDAEELQVLADMVGLQYKMTDAGQSVPIRDFLPGDYVTTTPGSDTAIPSGARRVETVRLAGRGGQISDIDVHVGSEVFGSLGLAAQAEAVRRLLRQMRFTEPQTGQGVPFVGGGGGIPDVVVSASDTVFRDTADLFSDDYPYDSNMLAEAMSMLPSNGGWIHMLQGTYDWAGSVAWDQGVKITGAGQGATILRAVDGFAVSAFFDLPTYAGNTAPLDNREQVMADITLDGNKAGGATVTNLLWVSATAVSRNVRIERCQFINATGNGIGGASGNCLFTFEEVEVAHNNGHGMAMQNASHHHNCWYHHNGIDGFQDLAHGGTHYFTNCEIYNNGDDGIDVQDLLARARLIVVGCSIYNNSGNGIVQGFLATASIIVGNVVINNTGPDIDVHPDSIVSLNITDDVPSPDTGGNSVGGNIAPPRIPTVVSFSYTGNLVVGVGQQKWVAFRAAEIIGVRAAVGTAPTGADAVLNVRKNGIATGGVGAIFTSILSQPEIAAGTTVGAVVAPDGADTLAAGDYLTVDIDEIGSTVPGADLTVEVELVFTETA